jgi:short-subunit dehydrogenase
MNKKKSVLISGTSTGIGKECALLLDKQGFKVFAGVRNTSDYEQLAKSGSGNIQPVMLDVCKDEDVRAAFNLISEDLSNPLFGLVNNAGLGISGFVEVMPIQEFMKLFEVNVFGVHRLTRAFLSTLRKNGGRIINIGSSSSYFSGPALGPYAATKFALRAYTDALRMEMKFFNVSVSLVAPGPIESAVWSKAQKYKEEVRESTSPDLQELYGDFMKAGDRLLEEVRPLPAHHVAHAVLHGLTARKPKYVYLIGKNARIAYFISRLPKKWGDRLFLNRWKKIARI